jgi:hypothetical protein
MAEDTRGSHHDNFPRARRWSCASGSPESVSRQHCSTMLTPQRRFPAERHTGRGRPPLLFATGVAATVDAPRTGSGADCCSGGRFTFLQKV